jgi:cytochrome c
MKAALATALSMVLFCSGARAEDLGATELQKCKICHSLDKGGPNRVGPSLYGVFGRKAGTVAGFAYSDAVKNSAIVWDDDTLAKFLRDPQGSLPGNRMSFPGIKDEAMLQALLQSLKQATQ